MSTEIKARVVGPAAPLSHQLDEQDSQEEREVYSAFDSAREAFVSLAKRHRASVRKLGSASGFEAPSAPGEDQSPTQAVDLTTRTLEPPFPFSVMCSLFENSNALRQNVDAMVTNIEGFGHRFEPVIDFTSPDINEKIRDLLIRQRMDGKDLDPSSFTLEQLKEVEPSIEDIEQTKRLWETLAKIEKGRLETCFEFINPVDSFTEVRSATRESRELLGNAAWEVIRENPGDVTTRVAQIHHVPFLNIRLTTVSQKAIPVETKIRRDPITFETVTVERFFRTFSRNHGRSVIYYKEFGDPRTISRKTGRAYKSVEELERAEEGAKPANELFHWKIRSPVSPYGVPRWIGALLAVLGSRAAEEVNFLYFDNKAIPPMVMLVSGGRLSESAVERIETHLEDRLKGRRNFHKILLIEGLPSGADVSEGDIEHAGKLRIELKPLMQEQPQDALFQNYDDNNQKKVGRAFRQPPILTGDTRDMNRSTAQVAKAFAEEQIYQPARDEFDAVINRHFLTSLDIRFWRFRTNAPVQRFPNDLVDNVVKSLKAGAMTPNEGRILLSDAFSKDLDYRTEQWAHIPPELAKVAARAGALPSAQLPAGEMTGAGGSLDDQEGIEEDGSEQPRLTQGQWEAMRTAMALRQMRSSFMSLLEEYQDEMFDPSRDSERALLSRDDEGDD